MSNGDVEIKTVEAVENAKQKEDNAITLSTGVVLKGKQVPPLLLIKIITSSPRPKVPVYMDKNMGREMENPDDPDYQERVKAWKMEQSNMTLNALILLGTELVSVPKKFPGPDEKDWMEEYQLLGIPMLPENKSWRYLTWLTYKAAPGSDDLDKIKEVVGRLSGIPESKVDAAEQFPSGKQVSG